MTEDRTIRVKAAEIPFNLFPYNLRQLMTSLGIVLDQIEPEYRDSAQLEIKVNEYEDCTITHVYVYYSRPMTAEEAGERERCLLKDKEVERVHIMNRLRRLPELFNDIKEGKVIL